MKRLLIVWCWIRGHVPDVYGEECERCGLEFNPDHRPEE